MTDTRRGASRALRLRIERSFDGRRFKPKMRVAVELALVEGLALREAARRVGIHHASLDEALRKLDLHAEWKQRRYKRLGGKQMPGIWRRHSGDVA